MAEYVADVVWERGEQLFVDHRYSRRHRVTFDGGVELPGSSSPHVVRVPWSDASAVDPEELFVASLSTCHMLWFLDFAARKKFCVDHYHDAAVGTMGADDRGRQAMLVVLLRPRVTFSGARQPTDAELAALHHDAHEACYIANSVKTDVRCEPVTS